MPLIEELALPDEIRGKANPKSSTGRLDVFTRVLTDGNPSFDEIPFGYRGKLYLEVVPRSYAIHVKTGLALNQLRLFTGDARLRDDEIRTLHEEFPLLYLDSHALRAWELTISDGLFLSVDLSGPTDRIVGYRAKRNSLPIDLSRVHGYGWRDYWEPVYPEPGSRIVLEPEVFYLLLSAEGACIPPAYAAEMTAYDPTAGELRTHYAGFFDPGLRLRPTRAPARLARCTRGARPGRVLHGRAPAADLQARVRTDARATGRPLRRRARVELPGPGDDAEQALRRAGRGALPRAALTARPPGRRSRPSRHRDVPEREGEDAEAEHGPDGAFVAVRDGAKQAPGRSEELEPVVDPPLGEVVEPLSTEPEGQMRHEDDEPGEGHGPPDTQHRGAGPGQRRGCGSRGSHPFTPSALLDRPFIDRARSKRRSVASAP